MFGQFKESEKKDLLKPHEMEEYAENYNYGSDSDLEDDGGVLEDKFRGVKYKLVQSSNDGDPPAGYDGRSRRVGRVIKIHDIAFITFVCFFESPSSRR